MRKISRTLALLVSICAISGIWPDDPVAQGTWQGPLTVSVVFPADATRPCAFFQLQGVTQADPAVPGPWFSIPTTNVGFHEQYALLLSAAFNNHPIFVGTNGQAACGFAQVVYMQSNFP